MIAVTLSLWMFEVRCGHVFESHMETFLTYPEADQVYDFMSFVSLKHYWETVIATIETAGPLPDPSRIEIHTLLLCRLMPLMGF